MFVDEHDIVPIEIKIEEDDLLYTRTDDLTEVFNASGEIYGEQRLVESIKFNNGAEKRVDAIINDVKAFSNYIPADDDILLLEINFNKTVLSKKKKQRINFVEMKPMDWHIRFDFQKDAICKSNPIPNLVQTIVNVQGFGEHREKIFLILTEMYSNSLEHGILNLNSAIKEELDGFVKYYEMRQSRLDGLTEGSISIELDHYVKGINGILSITMESSGEGFDYTQLTSKLTENELKSGRGFTLINNLCRKLIFSDCGRKLNVEYQWQLGNSGNVA